MFKIPELTTAVQVKLICEAPAALASALRAFTNAREAELAGNNPAPIPSAANNFAAETTITTATCKLLNIARATFRVCL
jgi:hypothetical protein